LPKLSEKNPLLWPIRHAAICLCDDLIEFASPTAHVVLEAMLPALVDVLTTSTVPTLIQAAAYGVAVCAQHGGPHVTPYVKPLFDCLVRNVSAPGARVGEMENATDNSVSALVKIAAFRAGTPGIDVDTIMSGVVAYLPLKADGIEARVIHGQVVQAISTREWQREDEEPSPPVYACTAFALPLPPLPLPLLPLQSTRCGSAAACPDCRQSFGDSLLASFSTTST
jgi:hypothetical protein